MSERKSWDVQRKPGRTSAPQPAPAPQPTMTRPTQRPAQSPPRMQRPTAPAPTKARQAASPQPSARPKQTTSARPSPRRAPLPAGTLRERRKRRRRVVRYVFFAVLALLVLGFFYLTWRPAFRITSVQASGPGADVAKQIALSHLAGTYLHVIPRNSVFFYPVKTIRAAILDSIPEASAVSLNRASFSSLAVQTIPREESFVWCGTSIDAPNADGTCYEADVQGYIFASSTIANAAGAQLLEGASTTVSTTSSPTPRGVPIKNTAQVKVYAPLTKPVADGQSPIRSHIVSASFIPNALKFVDAVRILKAPVTALAIRGDEADLWLGGNTRITYVLGHEQEAANTAASALPTLNLTDGSIQYIDLRFPGKAYVKKFGQ